MIVELIHVRVNVLQLFRHFEALNQNTQFTFDPTDPLAVTFFAVRGHVDLQVDPVPREELMFFH